MGCLEADVEVGQKKVDLHIDDWVLMDIPEAWKKDVD